jgi:Na+/phosphate symporter
VANADMLFNIGGVLLFIPFISLVEKLLNKAFPDKKAAVTGSVKESNMKELTN